ncbi:MAG: PorP/SprF family type IX secretion system membrane protein [Flavobacteriales bacterium]
MNRSKLLLAFLIILSGVFTEEAFAQDPTFSQFYSNPLYLNPAFAGAQGCPKIHVNQRIQWPELRGSFNTTSISFDKNLPNINSGYGVQVVYDDAGNGLLSTFKAAGMYSYQLKINKKSYILAGAEMSFNSKSLDEDKLVFGDQIGANGQVYTSSEVGNINTSASFVDFSFGAVGYTQKFYLGFAAHHITRPDDSFFQSKSVNNIIIDPQSRLPVKYTIHAGSNFAINGAARRGIIADGPFMTAGLIYQKQGAADQLNLGLSITNKSLSGGVWYRMNSENADAIILIAGYTFLNTTIGYSYDATVSDLAGETGGSHELSLKFQLPCKKVKKTIEAITCPKF